MPAANRPRSILAVVSILIALLLPPPAAAVNEDVNKYWDSIPAGIDPTDTTDSFMCWAAAASNVLSYTGWGIDNASTAYPREYDIYHEFLSRLSNAGGYGIAAYQSYFQWHPAVGPSPVIVQLYPDTSQPAVFISQAQGLLASGYGLYLSLSIGHAVTLWDLALTGSGIGTVTITDSDDGFEGIRTYELVQITEGFSEGNWAIRNYRTPSGMTIDAVLRRIDALAPDSYQVEEGLTFIPLGDGTPLGGSNANNWYRVDNPIFLPGGVIPIAVPMTLFRYAVPAGWTADEQDGPYVTVPEPSTALLLLAGLVGVAAFARGRNGRIRS
ncbi:MAG TPA: PEP-CTERM sorting domain-containing protein [Syntrophales bacterium]|nr:PEP-CTERM sorting domain-containing protein [Syntrophales bacterium]